MKSLSTWWAPLGRALKARNLDASKLLGQDHSITLPKKKIK